MKKQNLCGLNEEENKRRRFFFVAVSKYSRRKKPSIEHNRVVKEAKNENTNKLRNWPTHSVCVVCPNNPSGRETNDRNADDGEQNEDGALLHGSH